MTEKTCEWCKQPFTPAEDMGQAYCKRTHQVKASAHRKRAREYLEVVGKCPTPNKRGFAHESQAQQFGLPSKQKLYRCPCGALHARTFRKSSA